MGGKNRLKSFELMICIHILDKYTLLENFFFLYDHHRTHCAPSGAAPRLYTEPHAHAHAHAPRRCPHLPQQSEHLGGLLRLLLAQQPLDVAYPRHAPDVRAWVAPPQHPRKLVGLEHQGGEQQVPAGAAAAAAPVALRRSVAPLASPPGQLGVQVEAPLPGQLGTHHSGGDVEEGAELLQMETVAPMVMVMLGMMRGISQHASQSITVGAQQDAARISQKDNQTGRQSGHSPR